MADDIPTELLTCPACFGALAAKGEALSCGACAKDFPLLGRLRWLLPDVDGSRRHWRNLARIEIGELSNNARQAKLALSAPGVTPLTERRLRRLLQAYVEQGKALPKLLDALELEERDELDLERALAAKLPATQSLTAYYTNIHRDWGWPEGPQDENRLSLERVLEVLPKSAVGARILVLGAGAGRLAYDLHREVKPALTVAADFNPLMLYAARRLVQGNSVQLYEFPLAPLNIDASAVSRTLKAPASAPKNFHLVFADAMNPPFVREAWDIVLTPWLIDIVPQDLKTFVPKLNHLLKVGGHWVNFGSYAFRQQGVHRHYGLEEVLETVNASSSGFAVAKHTVGKIPYLQSPASCQGRVEEVLTFAAQKQAAVAQPPLFSYLPPWLLDLAQPIPALPDFKTFVLTHAQYAQTIALIDGKRSARDIAAALAAMHGMPELMALEAFSGFLTSVYEQNLLTGRAV